MANLNKLSEISNDVKRSLVFKITVLRDSQEFNRIHSTQCRLEDADGNKGVYTVNFGTESVTKGTKGIGYFSEYQKYVYEDNQRTDKKNGKGLFCSYIDAEEEAE